MKKYIRLMRVHHYIKNLLIFAPVFFSGQMLNYRIWVDLLIAFVIFCMLTSIVYVVNDIRDAEKDRLHPTKCKRPIASGEVAKKQAIILIVMMALVIGICTVLGQVQIQVLVWALCYFTLNMMYSMGIKNYPIIDIAIVAAGFLIRLLYGAAVTNVRISDWLYLTVTTAAFYFALGKRRNEKMHQTDNDTRVVLKYYSKTFLNSMMYVMLALTLVFYSLWTVEGRNNQSGISLVWTVPVALLVCMKYSLDIEHDPDGDPVEVLTHDKILLILCAIWAAIVAAAIYMA